MFALHIPPQDSDDEEEGAYGGEGAAAPLRTSAGRAAYERVLAGGSPIVVGRGRHGCVYLARRVSASTSAPSAPSAPSASPFATSGAGAGSPDPTPTSITPGSDDREVLLVEKAFKVVGDRHERKAALKAMAADVKLLAACAHPNIVRYVDVVVDGEPGDGGGSLSLLMEYAPGKDMEVHMSALKRPATEGEVAYILRDVAAGLAYLHDERRSFHRDMKPGNLLVAADGRIQMCDFGLARLQPGLVEGVSGALSMSLSRAVTAGAGTRQYMAPEQEGRHYDEKVDVWALGAIVFQLLTLRPYRSLGRGSVSIVHALADLDAVLPMPSPMHQAGEAEGPMAPAAASSSSAPLTSPTAGLTLSPGLHTLLRAMLSADPKARPAAREILAHPDIAGATLPPDAFWLTYTGLAAGAGRRGPWATAGGAASGAAGAGTSAASPASLGPTTASASVSAFSGSSTGSWRSAGSGGAGGHHDWHPSAAQLHPHATDGQSVSPQPTSTSSPGSGGGSGAGAAW